MPKLSERLAEWQTQWTAAQATITSLSEKLAAVEGRPDLAPQLQSLTEALAAAQTELAELKAAKPVPPPPPPEPPAPKPEPKPEPKSRKASLADKLRRKSGDDLPEAGALKHREPRRKLNLI
jgi:uncharacterized coiled-coil protein SlyX